MKPIYTSSWSTALPPTFRKIGVSRMLPRGYRQLPPRPRARARSNTPPAILKKTAAMLKVERKEKTKK